MSDEPIIPLIHGGLVNRLRELACPAGEPWTGDAPRSDHGHTNCYIIHLAADTIEKAESEIARLTEELATFGETRAALRDKIRSKARERDEWRDRHHELRLELAAWQTQVLRLLPCFDEPCRYDHHDYCQSHFLHERPCPVKALKELAADG